jgi:hypothetical protein
VSSWEQHLPHDKRVTSLVSHKLAEVKEDIEHGAGERARFPKVSQGEALWYFRVQHVLHLAHDIAERYGCLACRLHAMQLLLIEEPESHPVSMSGTGMGGQAAANTLLRWVLSQSICSTKYVLWKNSFFLR